MGIKISENLLKLRVFVSSSLKQEWETATVTRATNADFPVEQEQITFADTRLTAATNTSQILIIF